MKQDKFCFNKNIGVIALAGIVVVGTVILLNSVSNQQTSTNARAEAPSPSPTPKSCLTTYNYYTAIKSGTVDANQNPVYRYEGSRKVIQHGECDIRQLPNPSYVPGAKNNEFNGTISPFLGEVSTGKICNDGNLDNDESGKCQLPCFYGGFALQSIPTDKTPYYYVNDGEMRGCIMESKKNGAPSLPMGVKCDFSSIDYFKGGYPVAKVSKDKDLICQDKQTALGQPVDGYEHEECIVDTVVYNNYMSDGIDNQSTAHRAYKMNEYIGVIQITRADHNDIKNNGKKYDVLLYRALKDISAGSKLVYESNSADVNVSKNPENRLKGMCMQSSPNKWLKYDGKRANPYVGYIENIGPEYFSCMRNYSFDKKAGCILDTKTGTTTILFGDQVPGSTKYCGCSKKRKITYPVFGEKADLGIDKNYLN